MSRAILASFVCAAALATSGCDFDGADWAGDSNRYKEDFAYDFKLQPGGRIFLENFNGSVEVLGWDKDAVQVTGTKFASREQIMREIKIDTMSEPNYLRIRTIRPVERNCNCGAKYILRVPNKVTLERIESSNGSIRAEALEGTSRLQSSNGSIRTWSVKGDLEATTSNGSIELGQFQGSAVLKTSNGRIRADGIRGRLDADTSNGSIDVTVADPEQGRPLKLSTSNSSISLVMEKWSGNPIVAHSSNASVNVRLPEGVNADLRARTSNGSITSDFEVTAREMSKSRVEGRLGAGGPLIDLSSSNGSIRIQRR
jgi:hypothetical protein